MSDYHVGRSPTRQGGLLPALSLRKAGASPLCPFWSLDGSSAGRSDALRGVLRPQARDSGVWGCLHPHHGLKTARGRPDGHLAGAGAPHERRPLPRRFRAKGRAECPAGGGKMPRPTLRTPVPHMKKCRQILGCVSTARRYMVVGQRTPDFLKPQVDALRLFFTFFLTECHKGVKIWGVRTIFQDTERRAEDG